ncbi:hypothetical protein MKZ38_004422 [Zalerion maritima]|uniref:DUF1868 domain-containing protein n=1 Tax=Zalerion maritima TaxID=339359 RepID=A0AAD5RMI7_9PEZI|nr:hypothetical protein MKZ38_004422 [Zalerion maritima]
MAPSPSLSPLPYPPGVGPPGKGKFSPSGSVQSFPGNTIICHLPPPSESRWHSRLLKLNARLSAFLEPDASLEESASNFDDPKSPQQQAPLYALLPPSSYHITLFEGVCTHVSNPAYWPPSSSLPSSCFPSSHHLDPLAPSSSPAFPPPLPLMTSHFSSLLRRDAAALGPLALLSSPPRKNNSENKGGSSNNAVAIPMRIISPSVSDVCIALHVSPSFPPNAGLHLGPNRGGDGDEDEDEDEDEHDYDPAEAPLRKLRNHLSGILSLRQPGHEKYAFHLSLAYFIRWPTNEEREAIEFIIQECIDGINGNAKPESNPGGGRMGVDGFVDSGAAVGPKGKGEEAGKNGDEVTETGVEHFGRPEFCEFEDMFEFKRLFYLGD